MYNVHVRFTRKRILNFLLVLKYSRLISYMRLIILKVSTESLLTRLLSKRDNPKYCKCSSYFHAPIPCTNFVARLCTPSTSLISLIQYGLQIGTQYSKWGLTRDLYSAIIVSFVRSVKPRFIIPRTLLACLTAATHWSSHFKSSATTTPKSFSSWTSCNYKVDIK